MSIQELRTFLVECDYCKAKRIVHTPYYPTEAIRELPGWIFIPARGVLDGKGYHVGTQYCSEQCRDGGEDK